MTESHLAHGFFHGTDIDHHLVGAGHEVKHLGEHLHRRSHRDGQHNDVGTCHTGLQVDYFIGKSDSKRRFGIYFFVLDSEHAACKSPLAEIHGHGAADESETNYTNYHSTAFIFSYARERTSSFAHSDILRYFSPFLPKMNPGVMNTPAS